MTEIDRFETFRISDLFRISIFEFGAGAEDPKLDPQLLAQGTGTEWHLQESADQESEVKKLLAFAAAGEAATGFVLLVYPPIVIRLLFGAEIAGAGVVMSRIAGISLIAVGLACWPVGNTGSRADRALQAMLIYSLLVTLYLGYLGVVRGLVGILLWPAVGVHAVVMILLARAWFKG